MHGNDPYEIKYAASVTQEDIPRLPATAKRRIQKAIHNRLTLDPVRLGKPLKHSLQGHRRLRVGDYRIVYRIDIENHAVRVVAIQHRRHIY